MISLVSFPLSSKPSINVNLDFFTDMAAILNYLDLRSIMGCPGGMCAIRYTQLAQYLRALFGPVFP